jgi:hypothetical protein
LCEKYYYGILGHKNCPLARSGRVAEKEPIVLILPKNFLKDFREED